MAKIDKNAKTERIAIIWSIASFLVMSASVLLLMRNSTQIFIVLQMIILVSSLFGLIYSIAKYPKSLHKEAVASLFAVTIMITILSLLSIKFPVQTSFKLDTKEDIINKVLLGAFIGLAGQLLYDIPEIKRKFFRKTKAMIFALFMTASTIIIAASIYFINRLFGYTTTLIIGNVLFLLLMFYIEIEDIKEKKRENLLELVLLITAMSIFGSLFIKNFPIYCVCTAITIIAVIMEFIYLLRMANKPRKHMTLEMIIVSIVFAIILILVFGILIFTKYKISNYKDCVDNGSDVAICMMDGKEVTIPTYMLRKDQFAND